jgi:FkbM family methyltransferase
MLHKLLKRLSVSPVGSPELATVLDAESTVADTNPATTSRLQRALSARAEMGEDFFGGWEPSDAALFTKYASRAESMPGKITDFMGIRTSSFLHPWAAHFDNQVLGEIPIPDDSLRAEAIEYLATMDSLERAPSDSFTMAEVGASYAPWTCVGAVLAKRTGRKANLVAVEASSFLFDLIPVHLRENGVEPSEIRLINGAAGARPGILYFPKVTNPGDNGSQTADAPLETDYVGRQVEHEEVTAHPLVDLLPDGVVDLIHIDVQGVEYGVIEAAIDVLDERVRAMFIGTHSRLIEGQLLDLLHSHGWQLVRERPTKFVYHQERPDVIGWTTRDGGQYWINKRL